MAYDYNRIKNAYLSLGYEDQKKYAEQYKNDANFQQFYKDYTAEQKNKNVYNADTTKKMTTATNGNVATNSYGDSGGAANATKYSGYGVSSAGDYTYNPNLTTSSFNSDALKFGNNAINYGVNNPGYLEQRNNYLANALYNEGKTDEKSIRNYLNTFQDYRDYDVTGQNNTVQAILNRMGKIKSQAGSGNNQGQDLNSQLTSEIWNNYENYKNGYSDLMGGSSNYAKTFDEAVANKLKEAYGLTPEEFEERYPEQYKQTMEYLETVRNVWDNTDPSQRQMLDGRLQGIIGSGVGAGSDISKLNRLEESVLNKFKNPDKVKEDMQNIVKLQTEGKTTREIAKEMGISEDQVQQAILAYNGLDNKLGDYYQLTDVASKDITEPYDTKLQRLEEEKKIALERANRNVQWLKEDFDTNIERQKQQNDINAHNADAIAGRTGLGFSKRGIEGINYVNTQAQQIIDDLTRNYDRNSQQLADGIADIIRNWQWNSEDLTKASEEALTKAKNVYTSNMLAIQQQYGTVGLQAQQALSENVQNFIAEAESIYDNMLNRQQQNLSNLITNVSNLNALQMNNLALRNQQIQQFQAESLNMNRSQLQNLANQLGMGSQDFETLLNYQTQAVQNQLNGYLPGSGILFQDEISSMLESGANGQEVLQRVMNQPEFQAMQQQASGGSQNWAMSNGIMYNKATGEYQDLNNNSVSNEWGSAGSGTIYNKATGELKTVDGKTVSTTNANTGGYQQVKLDETPNVDTGIANVYGSTIKLSPTVGNMLNEAYQALLAQGIELKIGDSYRSYESQKKAYESGKEGVVSPDKSYHVIGQAFDLSQNSKDGMKDNEAVTQALLDAGFTRPNAKEWWHWSYGEGKDAFGGKPRNTSAYDTARAILNGVGTLPAKNSKEFTEVQNALNDLVKQEWGEGYPEGIQLINYSVINDKELSDTLTSNISSTLQSLYSTDLLNKLLDDNKDKIGPILSKLEGWNPYNADYAAINASIMQMASNVARGFGEKGVLTDEDIKRYMQTLPNQKMGKNAREVVGTLLKAKLYDGLVRSLESYAKSKRDVSMFASEYQEAINWLTQNGFRKGSGRGLTGTIQLSTNGGRS